MSKRKAKPRRAAAKRATRKRTPTRRAGTKRPQAKRAPDEARGAGSRKPRSRPKKRTAATRRSREGAEDRGSTVGLLRDLIEHHETGPRATAGDLDADWQRAESSGEEAVGGSVSTPDQDRGRRDRPRAGRGAAVGRPRSAPTGEMLEERDRRYWELERRAQRQGEQARRALTGYTFGATHAL